MYRPRCCCPCAPRWKWPPTAATSSWSGATGTLTLTEMPAGPLARAAPGASAVDPVVGAGFHAAGKPALEQAVDLAHLAPGGDFAVDGAEGGQHILAQVPQRFEVAGETHALGHPLHRVAAVDLEQRQHCRADLPHLTVRGTAEAEAGKAQKAKETAG